MGVETRENQYDKSRKFALFNYIKPMRQRDITADSKMKRTLLIIALLFSVSVLTSNSATTCKVEGCGGNNIAVLEQTHSKAHDFIGYYGTILCQVSLAFNSQGKTIVTVEAYNELSEAIGVGVVNINDGGNSGRCNISVYVGNLTQSELYKKTYRLSIVSAICDSLVPTDKSDKKEYKTISGEYPKGQKANVIDTTEWVDLGLPSGTLWKKLDTNRKHSYEDAMNLFSDTTNSYGGKLPTWSQWNELITNCSVSVDLYNTYIFKGPSGKTISFDTRGFEDTQGKLQEVYAGYYLCSTTVEGSPFECWFFYCGENKVRLLKGSYDIKRNVRLVK